MTIFKWNRKTEYLKRAFDKQIKGFPNLQNLHVTKSQYQELLTIVDEVSRMSNYIAYRGMNNKYYLVKKPV